MSLRTVARNPKNLVKVIYNFFLMRYFDNIIREIEGQRWVDWKNELAFIKTHNMNNIRV